MEVKPFPFQYALKVPNYQIYIDKSLYSYSNDLPEHFDKTTAKEYKMSNSG